jgi:hypothetical protein
MLAARVLTAMVAGAVLRVALTWFVSPETLHADIHGLGAYVGVIGGLYSIIPFHGVWNVSYAAMAGAVARAG